MILYEDNHLLIVQKDAGELVQGDYTGDSTILDRYKSYIKEKYNKPGKVFLHAVHRLDRPTSGVLILGRTSKALTRMTELFRQRNINKTYLAITNKILPKKSDHIVNYLVKDAKVNKSRVCKSSFPGAKKAELNYELVATGENNFLYKMSPLTGRSHQIRVQLANLKAPIIGDVKYGGSSCDNPKMIYLHCCEMRFIHPIKKTEISIRSSPTAGKLWEFFTEVL